MVVHVGGRGPGHISRSMGGGVSVAALTTALAADSGVTDFAIYDPSDLTSMFTTDTGTTQVSSDGDTVGLWLDKSQMQGKTAAAFATSQDEFIAGAWTQTVGSGTISGTATSVAFASAASGDKATSASTPTADNWYRYDITVSGLSGAILLKDNTTTVATISSNGTYTYHHKSASTVIGLEASGTTSATITISAKHIPGHHFSQATAASRPLFRETPDENWPGFAAAMAAQPELVTNGDFATGDLTGYSTSGTGASWSVVSEQAVDDGSALTFLELASPPWVVGDYYEIKFELISGKARVYMDSGPQYIISTVSTPGVYSVVAKRTGNTKFVGMNDATGATIDNVSVKEVPASVPMIRWVEGDGTDDWLPTNPLFDLGETWAHVGAWRVDADLKTIFSVAYDTTSAGVLSDAGDLAARDPAGSRVDITTSDPANVSVLTVERAATPTIAARYNGVEEVAAQSHYDYNANIPGLAIMSQWSQSANAPLDGRAYFLMFAKLSAPLQAGTRALAERVAEASTGETLL